MLNGKLLSLRRLHALSFVVAASLAVVAASVFADMQVLYALGIDFTFIAFRQAQAHLRLPSLPHWLAIGALFSRLQTLRVVASR